MGDFVATEHIPLNVVGLLEIELFYIYEENPKACSLPMTKNLSDLNLGQSIKIQNTKN
jgi:hypothetical protein